MRVIENKTRFSPAFMKEATAKFKKDVIPRVRKGSRTIEGKRVNTITISAANHSAGEGRVLVSVPDADKELIKRLKWKVVGPLNKGYVAIFIPSSEKSLIERLGWKVIGGIE